MEKNSKELIKEYINNHKNEKPILYYFLMFLIGILLILAFPITVLVASLYYIFASNKENKLQG